MIEVGNIVTLENQKEYLLLETLEKEGKKYLYAVRVLEDETPTDEFLIFESIRTNDEDYMKVISDKTLYDELIEDFKDIVADKIEDGILDDDYEENEEEAA